MGAAVYYSPFIPAFSGNGLPLPGAYLYFFYTGTTNLAPIYEDSALTVPMENPVQANLAARFANVYLDNAIVYRVRCTDVAGTPLEDDIDPYYPGAAFIFVPDTPEFAAPNGASLVGFIQAGAGAVARTVQDKARETVSVEDFGAVCDGVTDDTTAVHAAITYAESLVRRGEVFLPGFCKVTASLPITKAIRIYGIGKAGSGFIYAGGAYDLLDCNMSSLSEHGLQMEDFGIINTGVPTAGSAIRWRNVYSARIQNVRMENVYNGFHQSYSGLAVIDGLHVASCLNIAMLFDGGSGGVGPSGNFDTYVTNFILSAGTISIKLVDLCDELIFDKGVCSSAAKALYTDAAVYSVSQRPEFCRFNNVSFDTCTNGLDIANCVDMVFSGCFISNRPGYGVSLGNRGTSENIQFDHCTFFNNGTHGVSLGASATYVDFSSCKFISNSQAAVGVNHGLLINGAVTNFNVMDCCFFNGWGIATGQNYGLYIATAGANKFSVVGNDFSAASGATFTNASTGVDQQISDNAGLPLYAVIASAAAITLPASGGEVVSITGVTNITSITASWPGRCVKLIFAGVLTFTDGSNLKLAGNFVTTADDTITLVCDGANWFETGRSVN